MYSLYKILNFLLLLVSCAAGIAALTTKLGPGPAELSLGDKILDLYFLDLQVLLFSLVWILFDLFFQVASCAI
jgi:hypothetical protein